MWWVIAAEAQQQRCAPTTVFELETTVARVDAAFSRGDAVEGRSLGAEARALAPCVDRVVPAATMARLASLEALGSHLEQDPDRALRWVRAAEWSEPRHAWPAVIGADHPLRAALLAEGPGRTAPLERGPRPPRGGTVWLSGRAAAAEGPVDLPVLLQVCDATGRVVRAEWLEGLSTVAR